MTLRKSILVFILSGLTCYAADEDCSADVSKYNPEGLKKRGSVFSQKAKNIEKVEASELMEYGFKDKAKMKNNIEVTYTVGGCAHYGFTFTFKGKGIEKIKKEKKLERAEKLLKSLELTQDNDNKEPLLRALAEAKKKKEILSEDPTFNLPCGDASCALEDNGNHEVKISYDFAL